MQEWDGIERRSGTDRRTRRVYRFVDRRAGWDRRKRYPVLGTLRDHPAILISVLALTNVLSLVDGYFTAAELYLDLASEANPVLDAAAQHHPLLAVSVKVGALMLASIGIWHGRRQRAILVLAPLALLLFTVLVAYHAGTLEGLGWL